MKQYLPLLPTPNNKQYYTFTDIEQQQMINYGSRLCRTLRFKAESDAHIGLFDRYKKPDESVMDCSGKFYEIVLGGWSNTWSVIR